MGGCVSKEGQRSPVSLHIYDISGGRAAALSEALLGQRIEGVWHTGIVVFGREYYYGGGHGIESTAVGRTPYGVPGQTLQLGHTRATLDAFSAFLREIDARFLARHYHLFEHNCNSFTDECARFLTGKGIPDWIARQHELLLGTELGRRVGPLLMGMYNAMFNVQVRTGASVHTRPRREREVEGPVDARGLPVGWAARQEQEQAAGQGRRRNDTGSTGRRRGPSNSSSSSSHSSASYDTSSNF
eukprot:TRINITY_DN1626_c0_g1_i2.p1 TRINITY_DN1626_c0_g1~~TRINITY_DN1626_c0_g1_i2.p1  ORF type:complete len:243 (-),score=42.69 TRINITY_DN1626_c0_g1_i2:83-811(-)